MGSPPTPYNSNVRLIVYPTGFGTSQFERLFMLKADFFCNVSVEISFFHSRYLYRSKIARRIDLSYLETEQTPPERVRRKIRKIIFPEFLTLV